MVRSLCLSLCVLAEQNMTKSGLSDELEIIGYFTWFWVFVFSKSFRKTWIEEFKNRNWLGKFFDVLEAISSILVGLVLPLFLIYYFFIK